MTPQVSSSLSTVLFALLSYLWILRHNTSCSLGSHRSLILL